MNQIVAGMQEAAPSDIENNIEDLKAKLEDFVMCSQKNQRELTEDERVEN